MTLRTRMACMVILLLLGCVFAAPFYQTENSENQSTESTLPTLQIQWGTEATKGVEAPTSKAKPTSTRSWVQTQTNSVADTAATSKADVIRDEVSDDKNPILSRKTHAIFSRPIPDLDLPAVHPARTRTVTQTPGSDGTMSVESSMEIATRSGLAESGLATPASAEAPVGANRRVSSRPLATLGQPVASGAIDSATKLTANRARPWQRNSVAPISTTPESLSVRRTARRFEATDIQWSTQETSRDESTEVVQALSGSPSVSSSRFGQTLRRNQSMQVARKPSSTTNLDSSSIHSTVTNPRLTTERWPAPTEDQYDTEQVRESQTVLTPVRSQLASGGMRSSGIRQEWENDTPRQQVDSLDRRTRWHRISRYDNLSKLSKKYYGTPEFALFIFEANRQSLASPDILPLGLELIIPARASRLQAPTRPPIRSSGPPVAPLSPVEVQYGWRGAYEE